ncbi:MAG: phage holin family protein, partial [Verrucomicrobiaceae bacterium]
TVAVALGFTGWLLLMATVVATLVSKAGWSWVASSLVVGGVHVILGVLLFMLMMSRMSRTRWFEHTMNEFRKDRKWLGQQNEKS